LSQKIVWIETESSGHGWKRSQNPHSGTVDAGGQSKRRRSVAGKTGWGIEAGEVSGSGPEGIQSANFKKGESPDTQAIRFKCANLFQVNGSSFSSPLRWKGEIGATASGGVEFNRPARRPQMEFKRQPLGLECGFTSCLVICRRANEGSTNRDSTKNLKRKVT
jgi:hypothetical protein